MLIRCLSLIFAGLLILPAGLSSALEEREFEDAMKNIAELQEKGKLSAASEQVESMLAENDLAADQREQLEYELERNRRIRMDYTVTEEDMLRYLDSRLTDFRPKELAQWEEEGRFDIKLIDGEKRYMNSSVSNLLFRYRELSERRKSPETWDWEQYLYDHIVDVKEEVLGGAAGTGAPRNYVMAFTITVDPGTVPEGDTIRCWMPYPQQFRSQYGVDLLDSSPALAWVNAPNYPHRSLYFEQPSQGDAPTVFQAKYTVAIQPRHFEIDPEVVAMAEQLSGRDYEYFTSEQPPHVVFNDRIAGLAAEIVGEETNPARKARMIYDWVCENIKYSYAREYSTLRCIPEYVLEGGYGDCGQTALLYITLCRAAGVPARWQSGWIVYPQLVNLHDWSEIYLAPYGWVPVDADFGASINHRFEGLSKEQRAELRDFFFGGVDAYRLSINNEHGAPHFPPKEDRRSDDVDFQRGELEANGKNIYFDKFSYNLDVQFLNAGERAARRKSKGQTGPALAPGVAR